MSDYIVNKIIDKYKIHNFNTFFIFGENNETTLLQKFNRFVNEGYVVDKELKKLYNDVFYKIRKCIYGFQKLLLIWKIKKAKILSTDYDFILNHLDNFPESQKINIYHRGAIYKFRLSDIINVWLTSLCKNCSIVPMPEIPKNPYINIEFNKGHLLKFYIHIRYRTKFMVPKLIQEFINSEMDLNIFKERCYPDLIEKGIKNHLEGESYEILYFDCVRMVSKYSNRLRGRIMSVDINNNKKKEAVELLRPMLKKYLYSTFSCNPKVRYKNKINLVSDLKKVFKENVRLGRRIVVPFTRHDISGNNVNDNVNDNGNGNVDDNFDDDESLPDLSDTETDEDVQNEYNSQQSPIEEEIFYNEPFFYSTFVNPSEFWSDDDDDDENPMNQVD